jgi:Kdo2-lipid IVA lauroyltransferase/acyltransferase
MSKRKNRVLQIAEYAAYRSIAAVVRRSPDERIAKWGTRFGAASRRVVRRRDELAMRNLASIFPDKSGAELRAIADACWRHFGREMLAYVKAQTYSLEDLTERVAFVNGSLLEESRARGKGTIIISAHYGGWEMAGLALMALVSDALIVARQLDNDFLERDLARIRARTGAEVVDRRKAARSLMKTLSTNGVVVLLPDQAVLPREGILSPFLGQPAWTTPAPAKMAVRHGSTIVFAFCIPDGIRHRLEFEEPIRVDQLTEAEREPVALTNRINDVISRRIVARPELWLWMHDRWKGTAVSDE